MPLAKLLGEEELEGQKGGVEVLATKRCLPSVVNSKVHTLVKFTSHETELKETLNQTADGGVTRTTSQSVMQAAI